MAATPLGALDAENLINSIASQEGGSVYSTPAQSARPPSNDNNDDREINLTFFVGFLLLLGMIVMLNLLLNMHTWDFEKSEEKNDVALRNIGIFSTYYTGEYEVCETSRTIIEPDGSKTHNAGGCVTGNMHATIIFREMDLDSFVRVYLLLCFELPEGNRFAFWNSPKFGRRTFKRDRRVYLGLSGLEFTNNIDTLYLSGLSSVLGPFTSRAPLKEYWPKLALTMDDWNEYEGKSQGSVCIFNAFLRHPFPKMSQISLRQLNELYILGTNHFLLQEFEHTSDLCDRKFNIFDALYSEPKPPDFKVAENMSPVTPNNKIPYISEGEESQQLVDTMHGSVVSNDCGVSISFKGQERDMSYGDVMVQQFAIFFIMKSLLEIILLCKQLRGIDEGSHGKTLSIIAFSMFSYQDLLDIFFFFYHRNLFWRNILCFTFSIFIKIFLVGVVDHSYLVLIWRANHSEHIREGWEVTQARFKLFYRYYFSFIALHIINWYAYYPDSPWFLISVYLCWIPQILLDAWRGQCNSLNILTVIAVSLLRLYVPCYVFMLKENAFTFDVFSRDSGRTNRTVGAYIILVTLLQLVLMCLQRLRGARCFASWSILPQIYNYVRPWTQLMQDDPQECVICMTSIEQSKGNWSITPCDHLFHRSCLQDWTSVKMECPNCRHPLPPII
uniref:RING-type E3 ubiquitin transferase n=1 Tax=Babesia bovis TaxID=5865 RepID=A7AMZ2_BABBO|eukprot:XP_001611494.1 hypothetical protein [Babesia bovis T2Bo]